MVMTEQPHAGTRPQRVLDRAALAWRGRAPAWLRRYPAWTRPCAAWARQYPAWVRRHPLLVDAALVAALVLFSVPRLAAGTVRHEAWSAVLATALLLPLVWRRRAPFGVFAVIAAVALVQWFTEPLHPADLAVLIAFYTVAVYEPPRRILAAAVLMEVGAVLAAVRFAPHGEQFWGWLLVSGLVTAAGVIGYNVRTRRAYLAALEDRAARLERERDREAEIAAAAERARIAREMHDIVAHNIAVMIALADGAAYTAKDSPDRAVAVIGKVSETGRSALTEMRRLLGVMRQPADAAEHAPQPTLADVDDLLASVRAAGLQARLTETGSPLGLPPSVQLALYRMIQESLTNILKHASATSAHVRVNILPGKVELEVTDDGQGSPGPSGGHGIAGMRERAAVFGGEVSAGPRLGGGWRVRGVLYLDPAQPARAAANAAGHPAAAEQPAAAEHPAAAERPARAERA
jgi:signal transduction histidine kinase